MKKLILMGRVAAGKTTLTQALKGEQIHYCKTQYINYYDTIIDTPGEYTEVHALGAALAIYSYEADVVGIVISANEPFCVFPPACTAMVNREVIGIVTGIDKPDANVPQVTRWLKLCGCEKIFYISSYTGEGLEDIIAYLREDSDTGRSDTGRSDTGRSDTDSNDSSHSDLCHTDTPAEGSPGISPDHE